MEPTNEIKNEWYNSFKKMPWYFKAIIILLFLSILLLFARIGAFSEAIQKSLQKIFPIEALDCNENQFVKLKLQFTVNEVKGIQGANYKSGDKVKIILRVSPKSYVSLIGLDRKGVYSIINTLDPIYMDNDSTLIREFILNNILGKEVYYAIASNCPFSYEKDLKKKIDVIYDKIKGPLVSEFSLPIPYFHEFIYFNHTKNSE